MAIEGILISMVFQSPLRYPGGKSNLTYFVGEIMKTKNMQGGTYIEPFAGGAGIAINLLLDGTASRIVLNDADRSIYCLWKSIKEQSQDLCELIDRVEISIEEWDKQKLIQKNKIRANTLELGFSTLFLNRTNRSGIIEGGMIGGRLQNGSYKIDARFNKNKIIESIERIAEHAEDIDLYCSDAAHLLNEGLCEYDVKSTLIYADPPYYNKGGCLYMDYYREEDHIELSHILRNLQYEWLLSYDDAPRIRDLYNWAIPLEIDMNHRAHTNHITKELFFSKETMLWDEIKITQVRRKKSGTKQKEPIASE